MEQEKNKLLNARVLSFSAVAAIIGAGLAAGIGASAYGGMMGMHEEASDEERQALQTALEEGDYASWSSLMQDHCTQNISEEHFNDMRERHEEREEYRQKMDEVLQSGDYSAWKKLVESDEREHPFTNVITEDNFDTFIEMHTAMRDGDTDKVEELRSELGLPEMRMGKGKNGGRGMGRGFNQ